MAAGNVQIVLSVNQANYTKAMQEAQRQIAEAAGEELANFHTMLWSQWPDVVQHVRQHTQRGERS